MVKCILNDGIKCFVLIMQGVNHIGIAHSEYKTYGQTVRPSSEDHRSLLAQ